MTVSGGAAGERGLAFAASDQPWPDEIERARTGHKLSARAALSPGLLALAQSQRARSADLALFR